MLGATSAILLMLQATVAFTTVARGPVSQITEPREVVVRTADEWRALWKSHGDARQPTVDFSRSIVIGVFLGTRMTAGFEVDIVSIRPQGATTVVEYRERRPDPDALLAQGLTAPFHLVSVPRLDGAVEFRKIGP
jgi:hypothetical protein